MSRDEKKKGAIYKVVVNQEDQYSIWPAHRENARGVRDAGKTGTEAECLAFIEGAGKGKRPGGRGKKTEEA
ncbi:MAG TPA: MbtH family protein [Pyrinomonadaceae bacterium]|jgi:MbtH protein